MSDMIKGLALSGELLAGLSDHRFEIISKPEYVELKDFKDDSKTIEKMCVDVRLEETGQVTKYYPNMTSQKVILKACGPKLSNWIGYKGEFKLVQQNVRGTMRDVVYVEEGQTNFS